MLLQVQYFTSFYCLELFFYMNMPQFIHLLLDILVHTFCRQVSSFLLGGARGRCIFNSIRNYQLISLRLNHISSLLMAANYLIDLVDYNLFNQPPLLGIKFFLIIYYYNLVMNIITYSALCTSMSYLQNNFHRQVKECIHFNFLSNIVYQSFILETNTKIISFPLKKYESACLPHISASYR